MISAADISTGEIADTESDSEAEQSKRLEPASKKTLLEKSKLLPKAAFKMVTKLFPSWPLGRASPADVQGEPPKADKTAPKPRMATGFIYDFPIKDIISLESERNHKTTEEMTLPNTSANKHGTIGKWELKQMLGQGSFGKVYSASVVGNPWSAVALKASDRSKLTRVNLQN
jgi:hypothetical protein